MKRFFDKSPIWFAIVWIVVYVLAFGNADTLSEAIGVPKLLTVMVGAVLTAVLVLFFKRHDLLPCFGLRKVEGAVREYAFFLPLIALSTVNFWGGVTAGPNAGEAALYLISMVFVAVLEELIFRGLLFRAMLPSGRTAAIVVSSLTFGVGHIVNLLLGAALGKTLLQIVAAAAIGFCFTALFWATGSLIPCILAHAFINCTSLFALTTSAPVQLVSHLVVVVIAVGYGWWLMRKCRTALASLV